MHTLHQSGEDYLENILILRERDGSVRSVDLAREMGFSKPSISRAVHLLEDLGFLIIEDDGNIQLTESGESKARSILEKHTFLQQYFMGLGVQEDIATEDACRIEHVISDETIAALKRHLTCLHDCPRRDDLIFQYNRQRISEQKPELLD